MNDADIIGAINKLVSDLATNVPVPTISPLNFTAPSGADVDAKWREFLTRAQNDPDIVNYYNNLLEQAKGDTNLARSFLEKDYSMGTRQTTDTLDANLKTLGLTFGQEDLAKEADLNKRGIAMTDMGGGQVAYAAGGQPATELGTLQQSQNLRKEAEQRTARQGIEKMGLSREKGLTSAGQQLQQYGQNLQKQKETDIFNRGNTYYGMYQNKVNADAVKALQNQDSGQVATVERGWINPKTNVWDDNYHATGQTG